MGQTWEVEKWVFDRKAGAWNYVTIYAGNSLYKAFRAARDAKRDSGCIRVTWRP